MKNIAILIPNYNGVEFIKDTILAFQMYFPQSEIVVVDDASIDDSVNLLLSLGIKLLTRKINGGFAAGVNTGLKYLVSRQVDYIIVSNSDITINETIAQKIRNYINNIQNDSNIGIIGFQEANDSYFSRRLGDSVSGFFFCVKTNLIPKIGYLDENYVMYGEEQDYFRRVLNAGYLIFQSNIEIPHKGEKSGKGRMRNSWLAMRNALLIEVKFHYFSKFIRTFAILFLMINRIYRPAHDCSVKRILRPGVVLGNVMLLSAVVWNLFMLPVTLRRK